MIQIVNSGLTEPHARRLLNLLLCGQQRTYRTVAMLMEKSWKNLGASEKKKLLKRSTFEWKLCGGGRSRGLPITYYYYYYLHYICIFSARTHVCAAFGVHVFLSFFFREIDGPTPPSTYRPRRDAESNYAMSTSGRTFKLALIKYWLRIVFFISQQAFCEARYRCSILVQFVSACFEQVIDKVFGFIN